LKIKTKKSKNMQDGKICSNPSCHHSINDHYTLLRPKSADLMDTSCTLSTCEKFENLLRYYFN